MNFERAMDECRKAGGGRIQDSQCNTWRVNIEGDPIKICGCDCVAGYDWKCLPEQPQPAPQPELMTGIEAIVKTVNQGGGEIYYAATLDGDKGEPEFRVSVSSDSKIIDGTICALNGWGKIYTVRPLPTETLNFTEAMARLMQGGKVRDRYGNTLWPEIIATNDNRKLFKVDITRYSTDDQFTAVEA